MAGWLALLEELYKNWETEVLQIKVLITVSLSGSSGQQPLGAMMFVAININILLEVSKD